MLKRYFSFSLIFTLISLLCVTAYATHQRAGEITFRHLSGLNYEIKVVTYTQESAPADRPNLPVNFGDGSPEMMMQRSSKIFLGNDVSVNTYFITHTFNGPGTYDITVEDPNRNENVLNIPGSVNVVFFLKSSLTISAQAGQNNSVELTVPPIDDGCLNQLFVHNPGAVDLDGDSLVFMLSESLADGGQIAPGFVFPDETFPSAGNNLTIDAQTGTMIWNSPNQIGLYNVGILVQEWRNGIVVGEVLRDMQITIRGCANTPPQINPIQDTCVEAGTNINYNVSAFDAEGTPVTLSATGLPFLVPNSPANFTQFSQPGFASGNFSWNTICSHIRLAPYTVYYKANDNGNTPIPLVNFATNNIRVIPPSPKNPEASPSGNSINLNWDAAICNQASGYAIYRRVNTFGFNPSACETGVPAYTDYSLIGETSGLNATSFTDNDVLFGRNYCYMVVALYPDGSESYASVEFCAQLRREVPALTKVSIEITAQTAGRDTVEWVHPIELDTLDLFPPPYRYRLFQGAGFNNPNQLIWESDDSDFLLSLPTQVINENINTQDTSLVYRIELLATSNQIPISGSRSSTVWAGLIPNDMQLEVTIDFEVSWDNFQFDIFKLNDDTETFDLLGSTQNQIFLDEGLENGKTYCYYVVSKGAYSISSLPDTLVNYSQVVCGEPIDRTPPCPPELEIPEDCDAEFNELFWTNPAETCDDGDTDNYNIYYKETLEDEFSFLINLSGQASTFFTHNSRESLAGCYYVTAIDSVGNESDPSNIVCIDNCPIIELPNVFTPNGDGVNDNFIPIKVRHIRDVVIKIYNRWGTVVHENETGIVKWNGTFLDSDEPVNEGTYYYVATAKAIRLRGIQEIELKGIVTIFIDKKNNFD